MNSKYLYLAASLEAIAGAILLFETESRIVGALLIVAALLFAVAGFSLKKK